MIDLAAARETFEGSTDFTVGIEEEFALVDPVTHAARAAVRGPADRRPGRSGARRLDRGRADLVGDRDPLGAGADVDDARARQADARRRLFALARDLGVALGSTGTHPLSDYRDQHVIDTEHYHRVEDGLKYVAWRNNTFSVHVHVGVQGADRAVRVCDRLRPILPMLLAISANSPYIDGRDSGLHSGRTQTFTKSFPRCGIPDPFGSWAAWAEYVELLVRTSSIVEFTQLWWSVRPHHDFGTVEVRICDAQTTAAEADALAALIVACVRRAAAEVDAGETPPDLPRRLIEENMWRAIRYGLDGRLLDLEAERIERVRRRGGARPPEGVDGSRRRAARAQRRAAPAADDRRGRDAGRGVRRCLRETHATYSSRRPCNEPATSSPKRSSASSRPRWSASRSTTC